VDGSGRRRGARAFEVHRVHAHHFGGHAFAAKIARRLMRVGNVGFVAGDDERHPQGLGGGCEPPQDARPGRDRARQRDAGPVAADRVEDFGIAVEHADSADGRTDIDLDEPRPVRAQHEIRARAACGDLDRTAIGHPRQPRHFGLGIAQRADPRDRVAAEAPLRNPPQLGERGGRGPPDARRERPGQRQREQGRPDQPVAGMMVEKGL
jgi:hypothetical protein